MMIVIVVMAIERLVMMTMVMMLLEWVLIEIILVMMITMMTMTKTGGYSKKLFGWLSIRLLSILIIREVQCCRGMGQGRQGA